MIRQILTWILALSIAGVSVEAVAWEYSMTGEAEWRYRYWTRTGANDIFGRMADDVYLGINHLRTFPTTSTTNRGSGAFGVLAGENRFGADMSLNDFRMTIFPKIRVNKAIEITAGVNLTSLGIWSGGEPWDSSENTNVGYANSLYVPVQDRPAATNVPNTYVTLQWLRIDLRTPMVDLALGYRTSGLGMGLWKSRCNRASTSLGISTHYGPFKFSFGPYFSRFRSAWSLGSTTVSRNEGNHAAQRRDDKRNYLGAVFGAVQYHSGPVEVGFISTSYRVPSSQAPDSRGTALSSVDSPNPVILRYRLGMDVKYFDGRYFFNGGIGFLHRWRSGRGTALNSQLTRQNMDNDARVYGVETGIVAGPAKITLNYVRASGDDPSTRETTEDLAASLDGLSACYVERWGYLMYHLYGAGDGWDAEGYGQPTNLHHIGARLDYALASNLNLAIVGSFAWRDQPNAYRLGGDYRLGIRPWTNNDIRAVQSGTGVGKAVPDHARNIGWEVDFGVDWKLLEGLTWSTTVAFWQPGNWWSYAYPNTAGVYRAGVAPNANPTDTAGGEVLAIVGAGRSIDPLLAVESKVLIRF